MTRVLFVNAPVQNGDFTLAAKPGKAVGIRLAAALNHILGVRPVPHLWNTVTLAGDRRHRQHTEAGGRLSRADFEAAVIAEKYDITPAAGTATDASQQAADLAVQMVESGLRSGHLKISRETVHVCTRCGHLIGMIEEHACKACGGPESRERPIRLLVADRDPAVPVLPIERVHASGGRPQRHLRGIAGNAPQRLILSRDRHHGIDLDPVGLPGLVLDPRTGLHVTVLAIARAREAETVVMPITVGAAANIAAYGQMFADWGGTRLRYALHGRIPYDHTTNLLGAYTALGIDGAGRRMYETWFLPLLSLKDTGNVPPSQLPARLKQFHRACLAARSEPGPESLPALREQIRAGDPTWVTRKVPLATAMRIAANS